jgi:hypothetical protein
MRGYDEALQSAEHDYLNDSFDAAHDAGNQYVNVAIDEIVGNAEGEVNIRLPEYEYYTELVVTYETQLTVAITQVAMMWGDNQEQQTILATVQSTLVSLKTTIQPIVEYPYYASGTQRYQREQAVNNAITSLKAANKAMREAKEKEIAAEYRDAENEAWKEYLLASQTAYITYVTTYQNAENDYKDAKQDADNEYISTVLVGWNTYNNKVDELDLLFESAVAQAGNSNFNPATFFNNGVNGNQGNVLFVSNKKTSNNEDNNDASPPWWNDGWSDWFNPFAYMARLGNDNGTVFSKWMSLDIDATATRKRREILTDAISKDKVKDIQEYANQNIQSLSTALEHSQNIPDTLVVVQEDINVIYDVGIGIATSGVGSIFKSSAGLKVTTKNIEKQLGKEIVVEHADDAAKKVTETLVTRIIKLGTDYKGKFLKHEGEAGYRLEKVLGRKLERYHNADVEWIDPLTKKTYDLMGGQHIDITKMTPQSIKIAIKNFGKQIDRHLIKSDVTVIDLRYWPKEMKEGVLKILENYKTQIDTGRIILWIE